MAQQLEFPALVEKMKGSNTTEGYDVLVSYSEEKINQLLRSRSEELKSILEIGPLRSSFKVFKTTYDVDIYMSLDHPLLQFEDDRGNIVLKYNIKKGHCVDVKTEEIEVVPPGVVLSFDTIFTNATGTVESIQSKDGFAGSAKTASANEPVIINPDEKNVSQGVCITFEKASPEFIGTTDESKDFAKNNVVLLGALRNYFQQHAELKYYVAGVSNQHHPQLGSHSLQPRSFCFSTLKGETKDDKSALCMWISVKEGTNKSQSSKTDFKKGVFYDKGSIPIPRGRTCSLIVGKDLLVQQFLMPGLSECFKDFAAATSSNGGLKFSGNLIASDIDVPKYHREIKSGGLYPSTKTHHVDGFKFSPSEPKTTISFDSGINSKSNEIKYTSARQRVKWEDRESGAFQRGYIRDGTTNLEFVWTAKGSWKDKKTAEHPNLLGLDWTGDKDWTINKGAEEQEWWERIFGGSTAIPEHLRNLKVPSPNMKLEMNTLDYFLTTNLLYPGKHIFNADDPSSDSTDKGLALPHDLILTGEITIN